MPETEHPDFVKSILHMFTYGLFVATSAGPDGPRAAAVSWVTQASFQPRLVSVALRKGTGIYEAVKNSKRLALHVVGQHQPELARAFFKVDQVGRDEIAGYRYGLSERGVPIIGAACAWLECEVVEEANQSGDHGIFIVSVVDADVSSLGASPLALRETIWNYGG